MIIEKNFQVNLMIRSVFIKMWKYFIKFWSMVNFGPFPWSHFWR